MLLSRAFIRREDAECSANVLAARTGSLVRCKNVIATSSFITTAEKKHIKMATIVLHQILIPLDDRPSVLAMAAACNANDSG